MAKGPFGSTKLPKKLGGSQLFYHLLVNFNNGVKIPPKKCKKLEIISSSIYLAFAPFWAKNLALPVPESDSGLYILAF